MKMMDLTGKVEQYLLTAFSNNTNRVKHHFEVCENMILHTTMEAVYLTMLEIVYGLPVEIMVMYIMYLHNF